MLHRNNAETLFTHEFGFSAIESLPLGPNRQAKDGDLVLQIAPFAQDEKKSLLHFPKPAMAYLQEGMRGGKVLIYSGFRYHKNKATGNKILWRCWGKDCRASLQTSYFNVQADQPEITVLEVCVLTNFKSSIIIVAKNV